MRRRCAVVPYRCGAHTTAECCGAPATLRLASCREAALASPLRRSRQMPIVRSVSAMACAAVLTSACTDTTPLALRPNLTRSITASMMSPVAARSHPNSEKYRDSGFQPATGRSGSASVSTRALLDKTGTTDVDVTTGTFDGSPAPGTLGMVQVKAFTPSGNLDRKSVV